MFNQDLKVKHMLPQVAENWAYFRVDKDAYCTQHLHYNQLLELTKKKHYNDKLRKAGG